jgi:hypothetical protein
VNLNEILDIQPQVIEVEFGPEPSLRQLIEKYYEPHFPEDYKDYVESYLCKLQEMVSGSPIKVGDHVQVVFDAREGSPTSLVNYGVNLEDVGVVTSLVKDELFPVSVDFGNGKEIAFTEKELRKIYVEV